MAVNLPLDWLRSLSNAFLPQTCSVRRYTEVNTPDGVQQGWADVLTGVACRVSPRAATAAEVAPEGVERARSAWSVWLPYGTDVTPRDRLALDAPDGRVFEASRVGIRSYEAIREVLCVLVT